MTHPATPTFWLEPTDEVLTGLRRYSHSGDASSYHSALVHIGREKTDATGSISIEDKTPHDDPRWPTRCTEHADCGYVFTDEDRWQDWQDLIWRRVDTGDEYVMHAHRTEAWPLPSAPPGACWDASWMPEWWRGPDGISLVVRLPDNTDWTVDSEASNCTRKGQPHQCWVRHGDPRECHVTVDKQGDTCAAGAGSIASPGYHGFLIKGVLSPG